MKNSYANLLDMEVIQVNSNSDLTEWFRKKTMATSQKSAKGNYQRPFVITSAFLNIAFSGLFLNYSLFYSYDFNFLPRRWIILQKKISLEILFFSVFVSLHIQGSFRCQRTTGSPFLKCEYLSGFDILLFVFVFSFVWDQVKLYCSPGWIT